MSNYKDLYCQYCGRHLSNEGALTIHEKSCKENPNKTKRVVKGWPKGKPREKSSTKGKIWITNGNINKIVLPIEFEEIYSKEGWTKGVNEEYKLNISRTTTGKASTPEKEELRKKKISETMAKNPNAGGYRKGSGRGKQGWYKGIYCDSSWELAFLVYYLDHNMNIKRCEERREYFYNNEKHTYIPDFITDEGIVEIKGYKTN